ncbi:MAG: hypothetical protein N3I35_17415 [Clostridia bacterium]|nr:hypothetical protein [Clostridia bacterium]
MKVYMKPIKMICMSNENGAVTPIRFQIKDDSKELITIKVDSITQSSEEKLAGNKMLIYRCQSEIEGVEKVYELKYEISTCKWYLYKF